MMPSYKTGGKENGPGGERSLGHTEVQSDTGLSNGSLVSLAALLILPFLCFFQPFNDISSWGQRLKKEEKQDRKRKISGRERACPWSVSNLHPHKKVNTMARLHRYKVLIAPHYYNSFMEGVIHRDTAQQGCRAQEPLKRQANGGESP